MAYLRLDETRINYQNPEKNPIGVILSGLVESGCSPEDPVLVTSLSELDIYFGQDFRDREYFNELLYSGASLLLSSPRKSDTYEEPVIDISDYLEITGYIPEGMDTQVPFSWTDQFPEKGEEGCKYLLSGEWYVWIEDLGYVPESQIPGQIKYSELLNRDTLRLNKKSWKLSENGSAGFPWCWPKYETREYTPTYTEEVSNPESILQSICSHGISDDSRSIGFLLDFSGVQKFENGDYIVFPLPAGKEWDKVQLYFGPTPPLTSDIIAGAYGIKVGSEKDILKTLSDLGYTVMEAGSGRYKIWTDDMLPDLGFWKMPGLIFTQDIETTHNILSKISRNHRRMEFYSKTLGHNDSDIEITVENVSGEKKEYYRITLRRHEYQEVYEGPLYLTKTDDDTYISLEKIINQSSKLVTVRVFGSGCSSSNPGDGLPEGTYTLSRGKSTEFTPEDRWRGIWALRDWGLREDFLMIPRMEDLLISGADKDHSWYVEYEDLLDYGNDKNCQVLISNHPVLFGVPPGITEISKTQSDRPGIYVFPGDIYKYWDGETWTILSEDGNSRVTEILETFKPGYTGNHIFNYTKDPDNRLVYFYQDMTYLGWYRPAWYIFLRGIMSGVYQETTNTILYSSPAEYYTEEENNLELWKTNYLSDNGHIFYYRRFFSHPGDWEVTTSILTRFCMDKVTNTVLREFPQYLGEETSGKIIAGLRNILTGLKSGYPIIYSLDLDYIEENQAAQTLSVYLTLGIRETLDKDVKLSVTLNFNNT